MNDIVARFAPSPTGFLHLGGIRTALINFIFVEQSKNVYPKSKLLLRIEDTDIERSSNKYKDSILEGLKWLGIEWHGKEFIQSQRIESHKIIAFELLEKKLAFKCICTTEELHFKRLENQKKNLNIKRLCNQCENNEEIQKSKKNFCIRIKIPLQGHLIITDKIQGDIKVENKEIDNFILLRTNGLPTYMLSSVVDDYNMGVNTIIRGDDHLNNTFRQFYIYKHMKWKIPEYAHLPLIHGSDGQKLSKRHGAMDINEFKEKGYLPQAIINNLILLGWSPNKNNEIIEIIEIVETFNINKISNSSSIFDYDKLNYLNNYYLKKEKNIHHFEKFIKKNKKLMIFFNQDHIKIFKIFNIYKNNINTYSDLEKICEIYYDKFFKTKDNILLKDNFDKLLIDFLPCLKKISNWDLINLENCIKNFINDKKIKFSLFGKPIRLILTNIENGPSVSNIFFILGKKNTFLRLNNYVNDKK